MMVDLGTDVDILLLFLVSLDNGPIKQHKIKDRSLNIVLRKPCIRSRPLSHLLGQVLFFMSLGCVIVKLTLFCAESHFVAAFSRLLPHSWLDLKLM